MSAATATKVMGSERRDFLRDPLSLVLSLLTCVHATGAQYRARCPGHLSRSLSLSVRRSGRDGRVLIHCFAGCDTEKVLRAVGLTFRDLYPKNAYYLKSHFERRSPKRGGVKALIEQEAYKAAALRRDSRRFDFATIRSTDINYARTQANLIFGVSLKPIQHFDWEGYSPHDCDPLWPLFFERARYEATLRYPAVNAAWLRIIASKWAARWLRAEAR